MRDLLKTNFTVIMLALLVIYFSLLGLHAMHHGIGDSPFMAAMLDNEKTIIGAFLGLITGRSITSPPTS